MANNYYVGQAPIVNQKSTIQHTSIISHTPINVSPDMTAASALNTMAKHLNAIAETAKQLNDFNDTTQAITTVMQLNNDAIKNQWTPQEYQKQLNAITSKMKFDSPQLQAEINRRIDISSIDTMSKLTAIQTQMAAQKTIANLDQLSQTLLDSVDDKHSYMSSIAQFDAALNEAEAKKIITPIAAEKMRDNFRSKSLQNIVAVKMQTSPDDLIKDIKKGNYDGIMTESEKMAIVKSAKQYKLQQEEYNIKQIKMQREQTFLTYMDKLSKGEISVSDILRDNDLPMDLKQNILNIYNNTQVNSPQVWENYGEIIKNIDLGNYSNLDDLQQDMIKKGMPRNYFLQAQNRFLILQGKGNTSKLSKQYQNLVTSRIQQAMLKAETNYKKNYYDTTAQYKNANYDSIFNSETKLVAQQVKTKMLMAFDNCLGKNNEADCINNMDKFETQAINETFLPYDKQYFQTKNSDYFSHIYYVDKYNLLGKNYKMIKDTNFTQKLQKALFNLFESKQYNPDKEYDISKLLGGTLSPMMMIPLKKEYADKYKIGYLLFRVKAVGNSLQIIPKDKKLWNEIYGK